MQSPVSDVSAIPTDLRSVPTRKRSIRDLWPEAVVGLGLGLSAVWTILLVYGLIRLIELAI